MPFSNGITTSLHKRFSKHNEERRPFQEKIEIPRVAFTNPFAEVDYTAPSSDECSSPLSAMNGFFWEYGYQYPQEGSGTPTEQTGGCDIPIHQLDQDFPYFSGSSELPEGSMNKARRRASSVYSVVRGGVLNLSRTSGSLTRRASRAVGIPATPEVGRVVKRSPLDDDGEMVLSLSDQLDDDRAENGGWSASVMENWNVGAVAEKT